MCFVETSQDSVFFLSQCGVMRILIRLTDILTPLDTLAIFTCSQENEVSIWSGFFLELLLTDVLSADVHSGRFPAGAAYSHYQLHVRGMRGCIYLEIA